MSQEDGDRRLAPVRRALLFGNFTIGCGVMVTAGTLNDMAASLQVSVALVGQLIAIAAVVMGIGAPLLAGWVSGFDRRRLLAWSLLGYAIGHALCVLMPSYGTLWPVRALTMLGGAVFTPQAAAAIGFMAPPAQRGRAITYIFLGWSIASVAGLPLGAWLGETYGWRTAFLAVGALNAVAAVWVFRVMPDDVRPAALSARAWKDVFASPVLMAMVGVTALHSAALFSLFAYFAPYFKDVLGANPTQISLMFACYGACGFIGNVLLSRHIDRLGPGRTVTAVLCGTAISMLLWPLAGSLALAALVMVPGGLAAFAVNSGQQARLGAAAPPLAPALMALNTSAIYLGQAVGASGGGWLIAHHGYAALSWMSLGWALLAIAASAWVGSRRASAITA